MPMSLPDPASVAAELRSNFSAPAPLAVVLGSGFKDALSDLRVHAEVPYAKISGFPHPTVPGHAGRLVYGRIGKVSVLALYGRGHYYEGLDMAEVTFPV